MKSIFVACLSMSLVLLTLRSVSGCTCMPVTLHGSYKSSDFVLVGRVIYKDATQNYRNGNTYYDVEVLRVLKQDGIEIGTPVTRITTRSADSLCGVYLEVGQVYILNGFKGDSGLRISTCSMMSRGPVCPKMLGFVYDTFATLQSLA
ncbi:tissue inhibitor of metalloproteinase-like isoform X2 [Crassostrea angulata]|uniref:tissue inhibitor of metalloproteinase-like isoform X2 n=1 Tax=Magallana angulata TaxID=2784310 RepID=UPI0022B153E6|nr:tissue inhibitor of metalloproteinase-like isoform X2 [Crassostrea angulata]